MKEHDGSLYDTCSTLAVTHLCLGVAGANPVGSLLLLSGNTHQPLDDIACQHHVLLDTGTLDKQDPTQQGYHARVCNINIIRCFRLYQHAIYEPHISHFCFVKLNYYTNKVCDIYYIKSFHLTSFIFPFLSHI